MPTRIPPSRIGPETGEEIYHSFLGVPILRAGNTLGVLVVQNRARRTYSEEEVEALQTTAMVLAEMIASGELSALAPPGAEPAARRTLHLKGTALNDGIALGHVVLHEPRVVITNFIADDVPKERQRLEAAITALRADLDAMLEHGDVAEGGEHRDVLEAYRMFAHDRGWVHKLEEAVMTGLTAEAAVERVQSDTRARMLRQTDPYLRERLHDLDDLANRLLRQLLGRDHAPSREHLPENAIIVARSMGPAALLDYDRKRLRGLILEEGGPTSHVAIVARALGIAAVGEVSNAHRPRRFRRRRHRRRRRRRHPYPPLTRPRSRLCRACKGTGTPAAPISLPCATSPASPATARKYRCSSMPACWSTCRTLPKPGLPASACSAPNLQFMVAAQFPRTGEQLALYRAVLDAAAGRPVTFRTLDIGGDKVLPYMRNIEEENPALGGARSGSASTGRRCCAANSGHCFGPPRDASSS